tara:strand:- start:339 stop:521 length:183 start_codon:yes stop_codon:yes gene_type:complete
MYVGEFGRMFMPGKVGVITAIDEIENTLVYDVLFLAGLNGESGQFHTLRLFDEDLAIITS